MNKDKHPARLEEKKNRFVYLVSASSKALGHLLDIKNDIS